MFVPGKRFQPSVMQHSSLLGQLQEMKCCEYGHCQGWKCLSFLIANEKLQFKAKKFYNIGQGHESDDRQVGVL